MRVRRKSSLTFRLTLLFATVSSAVLLGLGQLIAYSVEQHFIEQDTELLEGKMELTRSALLRVSSREQLARLPEQLGESLIGHPGLAIVIFGPEGNVVFRSGEGHFPPEKLSAPPGGRKTSAPTEWGAGHHALRGITGIASTGIPGAAPAVVGVATEIGHHRAYMDSFSTTLWSFVLVAAVLTGLLGWVVTRRALAPLAEMRRRAEAITASRLNDRLSLEAVPAELAELAETLNAMLARLQDSFQRLSDFSSDLAHELRTPVSNLMTQTQVALTRERSAVDYRDILASNAEELERMSRMISDMLFLAKADNGLIIPHAESISLEAELRELFDFYEALAEEARIELVCKGSATVEGDRLMLRRALSNLLSNAIRHAAPHTQVTVSAQKIAQHVDIDVSNEGSEIAAEHLTRIFDRFYRADASRQRKSDGAGLGLAITDSIVRAHGGSITVCSAAGLTSFRVRLPAA